MVSPKAKCDECERRLNTKKLSPVNGKDGLFCRECKTRIKKTKRLEKFGHLLPPLHQRKRTFKPKQKKKDVEPKIPGAKKKTRKRVSIGNYISFDEWKFLFRKYMESGLDYEEAKIKIKNFKLFLKNQAEKLKDEKKSEEEIKNKLREKFEKGWAKLMGEEK